ncbi:uncharacterized protein LOC131842374 [Achroia grisella]|uniref:uncharacterized protein LOC131842374 n=1 Tax=Achroia grisella TaxID=688607 RepID=UPI0027D2AF71|nr:uncharacterized protein LOC131842374 [Achroia grisella]
MFTKNIIPIRNRSIIYYFRVPMIILMICGFNYNVFSLRKTIKNLIKMYTLILVAIVMYATIICCNDQEISQFWSLFEYTSSTIVVLVLKNNVHPFFNKLLKLDPCLRINKTYYISSRNRFIIIIIVIWLIRIVYTAFYCASYICYTSLVAYLINLFSLLALDANRVWRFAIYDEIRHRLKTLRMRLQEYDANYYLYVLNKKSVKENKMRFCLQLYINIADTIDVMIPELHASLFCSVFCGVPKLIINMYHVLLVIENDLPYESLGFMLIHIFQISIFLFSPCVVAELYVYEVEKIRLILMHRLIQEEDDKTIRDIELFLHYTRVRNFRYKIWRMIPVNLSFPLEFINLCTTYVIVVVNFTHLYG